MTTTDQLDHHEHGHDHGQGSDHQHDHGPSTEGLHPGAHEAGLPPQGGPVVVDIGGDVGALIVRLDRALLGSELHLRQDGWTHTVHTGVWDRPLGADMVTVAVYPALVEGTYEILGRDGAVRRVVGIEGGQVAELDLRG
jgi:ABC-type Zn2+ transport system substrate-binding protein/surface adhesin